MGSNGNPKGLPRLALLDEGRGRGSCQAEILRFAQDDKLRVSEEGGVEGASGLGLGWARFDLRG